MELVQAPAEVDLKQLETKLKSMKKYSIFQKSNFSVFSSTHVSVTTDVKPQF